MHQIRPMYAMKQDYHLKKSLKDHGFAKVADQIREELIAKGMSERDAVVRAPLKLEGVILVSNGEIDFKKIHHKLEINSKAQSKTTEQSSDMFLSALVPSL